MAKRAAVRVHVRLTPEALARLDQLAAADGVDRSAKLEAMIREYNTDNLSARVERLEVWQRSFAPPPATAPAPATGAEGE